MSRLVLVFIISAMLPVAAEEKVQPGKPTEILRVPTVEFVAEQIGKFEEEVKEALLPVLQTHPGIRRGYLVAVLYDGKQQSVALCLESQTGPNERVVKEISE